MTYDDDDNGLFDFLSFDQDEEDELLKDFEKMLKESFSEKSEKKPVSSKKSEKVCDHKWKKIPGFLTNSFYEICEICKIDKEKGC